MNAAYKALTLEWLRKAQSDLLFAEASLREFSGFYSQICILCHDSAEKYLKAFLIANGTRPDRVHDLMALLHECLKIDASLDLLDMACSNLNDYYIPLKYPSHYPDIVREQSAEAFESAKLIQTEIEKRIYA